MWFWKTAPEPARGSRNPCSERLPVADKTFTLDLLNLQDGVSTVLGDANYPLANTLKCACSRSDIGSSKMGKESTRFDRVQSRSRFYACGVCNPIIVRVRVQRGINVAADFSARYNDVGRVQNRIGNATFCAFAPKIT